MKQKSAENSSSKLYIQSLVYRAKSALAAMKDEDRERFNSELDGILALPTPEKEDAFVALALTSGGLFSDADIFVHAA